MNYETISIDEIAEKNRSAGYHFFDRPTLRFFGCRLPRQAYRGPGGTFFVTSDRWPIPGRRLRRYTVHRALPDGQVPPVGIQHAYPGPMANRIARYLAGGKS